MKVKSRLPGGIEMRTPNQAVGQAAVWRYIHCAKHHPRPCQCPMGPQGLALETTAFEILIGGGRGGIKTETGFGFLLKGNPAEARRITSEQMELAQAVISGKVRDKKMPLNRAYGVMAHISYINHPNYKFLVLRKNAGDLVDWWGRAYKIFEPLGAHFTGFSSQASGAQIQFPSGALGVLGHLKAEDAYTKYQGHEYARIYIDELEHIPSERLYERVIMSCRVKQTFYEMKEQVMATANPGGVGTPWIKSRWMVDAKGEKRPIGQEFQDAKSGMTRIFFHTTVADNPYLKGYAKQLSMLGEQDKKCWLYGDFDALVGQYFTEFRATKNSDEPPEALHVVPDAQMQLAAWWPRAIGLDWGYQHNAAAIWGCWHPAGRLNIYRELSVKGMGCFELGSTIAKMSLPELEQSPNHHLTIFLSHDAFHREGDTYTRAEQIKTGIDAALGDHAAFVLAPNQSESLLPADIAWQSILKRQKETQHQVNITIMKGSMDRMAGWSLLRDYMRWTAVQREPIAMDDVFSKRLLNEKGLEAYRAYLQSIESQKEEVRPKIWVAESCKNLKRSLLSLVYKEGTEDAEKTDGDDEAEALRYLVTSFRFSDVEKPRDVWIQERVDEVKRSLPGLGAHGLAMTAMKIEQDWRQQHTGMPKGITLTRHAGRMARMRRAHAHL